MTDVEIIRCTEPTDLYRHYAGQSEPQDAYIELDLRSQSLLADYNTEIGNAVPFAVHHGFERRYAIPMLTGEVANRVMEEIAPLAGRMLADWTKEWNGNNMVARLGEDAQAAEAELAAHLGVDIGYSHGFEIHGFGDADLVAEWDVDGAVNGEEAEIYSISADTTDERLDEIAAEITRELADCGEGSVAVVYGLDDYLRQLRNDLAQQSD